MNHLAMIGEMALYDNGVHHTCVGVILRTWRATTGQIWLECLWDDGEVEGISFSEISLIKRKRGVKSNVYV